MNTPRIALIHATPVAMQPIQDEFARAWPQALTTNLLDDSLSRDLAAAGNLTPTLVQRFVDLTRYVRDCGADAVMFTCSAFGPAIEAARQAVSIPVLKPNEAMVEEALAASGNIALLATFASAAPPMRAEIEAMAAQKQVALSLRVDTVAGALAALQAGNAGEHDRLIAESARGCVGCDVILLGQFSMASAAHRVAEATGKPVLTSPGSAVALLKRLLA